MHILRRRRNFSFDFQAKGCTAHLVDRQCQSGHLSTTSFTNWNSTRSLQLLPGEINDGSDRYSFKVGQRDKTRVLFPPPPFHPLHISPLALISSSPPSFCLLTRPTYREKSVQVLVLREYIECLSSFLFFFLSPHSNQETFLFVTLVKINSRLRLQ